MEAWNHDALKHMEAWKHGNTRALACGVFHCLLFACCTFLSLVTNKQMSQRISFLHSPPRNVCLSCRYTIINSGRKSMALHTHAGSWTQCTVLYFIVNWCGSDALCFGVTRAEVAFIAFRNRIQIRSYRIDSPASNCFFLRPRKANHEAGDVRMHSQAPSSWPTQVSSSPPEISHNTYLHLLSSPRRGWIRFLRSHRLNVRLGWTDIAQPL
jgi:hypothetical protein